MIYRAAIKKDDRLFLGYNHADIVEAYADVADLTSDDCIKGFYTDGREFLDRHEAAKHAYKCGQVKHPITVLYSCDIEMKVSA